MRVVHGSPTDEELAALVVVLATRARSGATAAPSDAPGWGVAPDLHPGRGAWRRSAWLPGVRTSAAT